MIKYHTDLIQGSTEWLQARVGLLTASEMKLIVTPTLKVASNDKERAHLYELLAQRVNNHVEPSYIGDAMLRGKEDEIEARILYDKTYEPVEEIGFITNDKWGFTLGYSPDGLLRNRKAAIECKSRCQKYQMETLITGQVPEEYKIQIQTGMLVGELDYVDFVTYCGGMRMYTIRVEPDEKTQAAIIEAATAFEDRLETARAKYAARLASGERLIKTERKIIQEMHL